MKDRGIKRRLFAPALGGTSIELSPEEARHALTVLRLSAGDEVELFDGAGGVAQGTLASAGKKGATVEIAHRQLAPRPSFEVELAFAIPKGKRLDWLLEKATELGAAVLSPVVLERSVVTPDLSEHAAERWRGICISAAKQCGNNFLPKINPPRELGRFLAEMLPGDRLLILGDPDGQPLLPFLNAHPHPSAATIMVGPEGGISEGEQAQIVRAGFAAVRLGNLILRVETAAIALLAAVQALQLSTRG
jgi:16S rRNA (uracil1498-N3)-methyltransferase